VTMKNKKRILTATVAFIALTSTIPQARSANERTLQHSSERLSGSETNRVKESEDRVYGSITSMFI
jgi:hypothetical protein